MFRSLVSLQRLTTWGLGPEPSAEALAHEITTRRRELFIYLLLLLFFICIYFFEIDVFPFRNGDDEGEQRQRGHGRRSQIPVSSSHRRKRKNISSRVDLSDLPSRRGREKKHKSKPQDVKSPLVSNQESSAQILTLDSEPKDPPSKKISSIVHAPTPSTPSKEVPQHLLGNEDLA